MMMMTRGEERGGWTVCLYQWRTTIVQNINHIRYISNISKVLNDDDDQGGEKGGWTAGLYQRRNMNTIVQNIFQEFKRIYHI